MATMKFKKEKVSALTGETEVRFTEEPKEGENPFPALVITATPRGVFLTGNSTWLEDMTDLQSFAKAMSDAWVEHRKLRPEIHIASAQDLPTGR